MHKISHHKIGFNHLGQIYSQHSDLTQDHKYHFQLHYEVKKRESLHQFRCWDLTQSMDRYVQTHMARQSMARPAELLQQFVPYIVDRTNLLLMLSM